MRYPKNTLTLIIRIMILPILASCSLIEQAESRPGIAFTPTTMFVPIKTEAAQTPLIEITESWVAQTAEVTIPLVTPTPFSTSTLTPTSILIWTPVFTLSPQKAHAFVRNLLENNGGCELPCWWGMVPGKTDWNTAKQHLETFVKSIEPNGEGQIIKDDLPIHWADFLVRYEIDDGIEDSFNVSVENGIIEEFLVGVFRLDRLLSSNGPPDEVYISAHRVTSEGGPPPFYFLVYYGQKGFWAQYDLNGEVAGNIIKGCPQSIDPARIWLGSPKNKWKKEDLWDYVFGPPIASWAPRYPILTLKEATGMDLDTFTNTFKDPNNPKCIETSAKLWD